MIFLVLLLYMFFASSFTLAKGALDYVPPILFVGMRMVCAGLLMLGYQYIFDRKNWRLDKKDYFLLFQLVIFHVFLTYVADNWALQYVTSFKASLLFNISPFITALLSYFLFSERLTSKQWAGMGIGFLGFLPILIPQVSSEEAIGQIGFFSLPEIALFCAVASACYGWILLQRMVSNRGYSPIMANGASMLIGGLLAVGTSFFVEHSAVLSYYNGFWDSWHIVLFYLSSIILVSNLISYNLYGFLLKDYSATFLSFAGLTTPLFAALFGWFFLHEIITWHFYVSMVIILFGLYVFHSDELKK